MRYFQLFKIIIDQNVLEPETENEARAPPVVLRDLNESFDIFKTYDQDLNLNEETDLRTNDNLNVQIRKEINRYEILDIERNPSSVDVTQWWKVKSVDFPLLSKAARYIFSIPAGSSSTENSFSSAGFVFNERRTNLKPRKFENLLFIRSNKELNVLVHDERNDNSYYDDSDIDDDSDTDDDDIVTGDDNNIEFEN